ncbi:MAG TPA: heavy-metal-associated domain-containing protein [Myxococcota bacterium]|nr:heavy-metal-associated domain-containing protein [Myxococcota bacterium]
MRTLALTALLAVSAPALACPMADAAAFASDLEKVTQAPGTKVSLAVTGLSCGDCSSKVATSLAEMAGVNAVAVDYQTGRAEIAYDAAKVKVDALVARIKSLGYAAQVAKPS